MSRTWLVGVSAREYREIEAGDREPSPDAYEWIRKLHGWPQKFVEECIERAFVARNGGYSRGPASRA